MGAAMRKLWRPAPPQPRTYEKALSRLADDANKAHSRMSLRANLRRTITFGTLLYGAVMEVIFIILASSALYSNTMDVKSRAMWITPACVFPLLAAGFRRLVHKILDYLDKGDKTRLTKADLKKMALIDELKERTAYNATVQLIEKYSKPAAEAGPAESKASPGANTSGLRRRGAQQQQTQQQQQKNAAASKGGHGTHTKGVVQQPTAGGAQGAGQGQGAGQTGGKQPLPPQPFVQPPNLHPLQQQAAMSQKQVDWQGPPPAVNDPFGVNSSWMARLAAMLVGEDPTQCYALICESCKAHNGLAKKEDMPIRYFCPHCRFFNGPTVSRTNTVSRTMLAAGVDPVAAAMAGAPSAEALKTPNMKAAAEARSTNAEKLEAAVAANEEQRGREEKEKEAKRKHKSRLADSQGDKEEEPPREPESLEIAEPGESEVKEEDDGESWQVIGEDDGEGTKANTNLGDEDDADDGGKAETDTEEAERRCGKDKGTDASGASKGTGGKKKGKKKR